MQTHLLVIITNNMPAVNRNFFCLSPPPSFQGAVFILQYVYITKEMRLNHDC